MQKRYLFLTGCVLTVGLVINSVGAAGLWPPQGTDWSTPKTFSDDPLSTGVNVTLAVDSNDELVAVYENTSGLYHPNSSVSVLMHFNVVRSIDGARTWSSPVTINPNPPYPEYDLNPDLAAGENSTMMLAWKTDNPNGLFYTTSLDSGVTWDAPTNFFDSENTTGSFVFYQRDVQVRVGHAGGENWLYMVRSEEPSIDFARSPNNGFSWYGAESAGGGPDTTAHGDFGLVHNSNAEEIMMFDANVPWAKFSFDNGATFGQSIAAEIGATDGNGNWLLARGKGRAGISLFSSSDHARTFTPLPDLPPYQSEDGPIPLFYPHALAVDGRGNVMFIIRATYALTVSDSRSAYFVTTSRDFGQNWYPYRVLGLTAYITDIELVADSRGRFTAAWRESWTGENVIKYSTAQLTAPATAQDWQLFE